MIVEDETTVNVVVRAGCWLQLTLSFCIFSP